MNKSYFAIVSTAALLASTAAYADTTLYGNLRFSLNSIDEDTTGGIDGIQGKDNVSLFGLKGSIGESTKAFFHLQTGAPSDGTENGNAFQQRFFFGGLSGGFGKVAYGRMTNAYKFPGFKLDPFYNLSHIGAGGTFGAGGATYGLSPATNGFTDNAVQYFTPSFGGLKINIGSYIDDSNEDEHGYNVGGQYESGGFNVGVQLASNGDTGTVPSVAVDGDAVRVHGGYDAGKWNVAASYEQIDVGITEDVGYVYLVGQYNLVEKTRLALALGSVDDGPAEGEGYTAGVFQTVAPATELYASYSTASIDTTDTDPSVFSIGAIHKF